MFCGASFRVLNNAINTAEYKYDYKKRLQTREKLQLKKDEFVVGHVGRFSPPKNHDFLIDIFYQLKLLHPNSKLLLVGDDRGELANKIKHKVRESGLSDSVIFTGLRKDVTDLMQAMDVFVFPSFYEGMPVTLIEAQASGLPCVISDKVPIECKKTELVQQMSLTSSAAEWAKLLIKKGRETVRQDTSDLIKKAGFDIGDNAKWLQQYYLEKAEEIARQEHNESI